MEGDEGVWTMLFNLFLLSAWVGGGFYVGWYVTQGTLQMLEKLFELFAASAARSARTTRS